VTNSGDTFARVFDAKIRTEVKRLPVGQSASNIGFARDGRTAFIAVTGANAVAVIDTTGTWRGRTQGFEIVADAADAVETRFAAVGYEQNGAFAYTGHLNRGGDTDEYTFDYPGDESVYTIGLQVSPDVGAFLNRAGFKVYNPSGAVHVTGGPQVGLVPNVAANVISRNKGRHVVQVYNYHPEAGLDYALTLTPGLSEGSRR